MIGVTSDGTRHPAAPIALSSKRRIWGFPTLWLEVCNWSIFLIVADCANYE